MVGTSVQEGSCGQQILNEPQPPQTNVGLPDCDKAVIKFLGPRTQHTRHPGRRQFYEVNPYINTPDLRGYAYLGETVHNDNRILYNI